MRDRIVITGLYRSGTTFVQQVLNSSPSCKVLYQPYFPVFKEIDTLIRNRLGRDEWRGLPLGATGYLCKMDRIDPTDIVLGKDSVGAIRSFYKGHAADFQQEESPDSAFFHQMQQELGPGRLPDVWHSLFASIDHYFHGGCQYIGFKELFIIQHFPLVSKFDLDVKLFCLMRDPREIYFSRLGPKYGKKRHPVLMVAEIWKQYAQNLLYLMKHCPNVILVRYDDFSDEGFKRVLFEKLKNAHSPEEMVWKANTSGNDNRPGYGKRWIKEMPEKYIAAIEMVCAREMEAFGYGLKGDCRVAMNYQEDFSDVLGWARLERYASFSSFREQSDYEFEREVQ